MPFDHQTEYLDWDAISEETKPTDNNTKYSEIGKYFKTEFLEVLFKSSSNIA